MVSVVSLAFGYLIVNLFSSSANLAGDVCSTLFGSVSILTLKPSEVYNMMLSPEDYTGKTVKMEEIYSVFYDEVSDKYYFACIIMDATACCSQGIEFELRDDYKYPDDYPEEGSYICVEGVFDTYMEGENLYCTLRDAELDSWTAGSIEEVR